MKLILAIYKPGWSKVHVNPPSSIFWILGLQIYIIFVWCVHACVSSRVSVGRAVLALWSPADIYFWWYPLSYAFWMVELQAWATTSCPWDVTKFLIFLLLPGILGGWIFVFFSKSRTLTKYCKLFSRCLSPVVLWISIILEIVLF